MLTAKICKRLDAATAHAGHKPLPPPYFPVNPPYISLMISSLSWTDRNGAVTVREEGLMGPNSVGWLTAIIVGALAGWIAEQLMHSNQGLLMNIVLGILGAIIASALMSVFGIMFAGVIGYLIAGIIGACILIALGRMLRGRTV
jgi:uncharacterized membrane protein YeaQ/YmgE (transglycosylase-associated protein family)